MFFFQSSNTNPLGDGGAASSVSIRPFKQSIHQFIMILGDIGSMMNLRKATSINIVVDVT